MVAPAFRHLTVAALLFATAFGGSALADYGPVLAIEDLTDSSALVVRGRVHDVVSGWDRATATIYTYVTVDVDSTLRGHAPGRLIVKQLGGVVGDIGLSVGGQPDFVPGEDVLLFLHVRPRDNTLQTANFWQGKWTIELNSGRETALRHAGRDADGIEVASQRLDLADLEGKIAARSETARTDSGQAIVFLPGEAPKPNSSLVAGGAGQKIPFAGFSWHEAFAGANIPVNFHKSKQPGVGSGKKQIQKAWDSWNDLANVIGFFSKGSRFKGAATGTGQRALTDATVLVQHGDPLGEISNASSTLAVGGAWFFTGPQIRDLGPAFSGYVVVQDAASAVAFMAKKTCYQTIIAHELGHVGGLGHSNKSNNLMQPSLTQAECDAGVSQGKDDAKFWKKLYNKNFARSGH